LRKEKIIVERIWRNLKSIINSQYTILVFRLILGGIFIYASLDKIAHPEQFAQIVYNYKILPHSLINIFAIVMPWVELICGIFVIGGIFVESSSAILSLLLASFIIALSVNFLRGLDINCGCFSTDSQGNKEGAILLIRDFVLLAIGLQIFFSNSQFATLTSVFNKLLTKLKKYNGMRLISKGNP
jgi:uncharacterized membrane protein YphA (DoxX/SURF4 family)